MLRIEAGWGMEFFFGGGLGEGGGGGGGGVVCGGRMGLWYVRGERR